MPEGDTVWRSCQRLHEVLAGRELTRCEFRVPSLATTDLKGVGVREVVSRGKHQLFRFANDFTLHTHFRMDGSWRIYPVGRRWSGGPEFQIRAILGTAEHACVGYRLPVVETAPDRRGGLCGRPSRTRSARLGLGLGRGCPPDRGPTRPQHRRGAAGPAQPGRHRHLLPRRAAVPPRPAPAHAGARGQPPVPSRAARPATAPGQPLAAGAVDHRRSSAGSAGVRVRAARANRAGAVAHRSRARSSARRVKNVAATGARIASGSVGGRSAATSGHTGEVRWDNGRSCRPYPRC